MQIKEEAEHPHDDNDSGRRDTRVNKHKVGVKRVHAEKWIGLSKEALKMEIYLVFQVDNRCRPLKASMLKSLFLIMKMSEMRSQTFSKRLTS